MDWISNLITDICELSDRNSPADQPDMMLITGKELRDLIDRRLEGDCLSVIQIPLHPVASYVVESRDVDNTDVVELRECLILAIKELDAIPASTPYTKTICARARQALGLQ